MSTNQCAAVRCRNVLFCIAVVAVVDAVLIQASQPEQTLTISVNDPRPLAGAIQLLEKRHGWVITYEDPPLLNGSDTVDVTSFRKDGRLDKRVLSPRGGTFTFNYSLAVDGHADALPVLETLVNEYNTSGHPGAFRVSATGSVFHVVPSQSRNAAGRFEPRESLLDANISVKNRDWTALELLGAVVDALSQRGPARVVVGTVPVNLLAQSHFQIGFTDEKARTVLLRTLEATHRNISWRILCEPGTPGTPQLCALNLQLI